MNTGSIIESIDSFNVTRSSVKRNLERFSGEVKDQVINPEPEKSEILNVIDKLNNSLENVNEKVFFSYHEENNRIIVKVIDKQTKEIVREIPPRDIVKLSEHLREYLGLLVDESR